MLYYIQTFPLWKCWIVAVVVAKLTNRYFFCCKRRCTPCLIASPFVMLCSLQYNFNLSSVSLSRHTLKRFVFGSSTFGLPAGLIFLTPPNLHHTFIIFISHLNVKRYFLLFSFISLISSYCRISSLCSTYALHSIINLSNTYSFIFVFCFCLTSKYSFSIFAIL